MQARLTVVSYKEFCATERQAQEQLPKSKDSYARWKKFHSALMRVARRFGRIGWDEDVDFYHGGDWFHELADGMALHNPQTVTVDFLQQMQAVVSKHHRRAYVMMGGRYMSSIGGLCILLTSKQIVIAWYECTAAACKRALKTAGLDINHEPSPHSR